MAALDLGFGVEQVSRYLALVDRRFYIMDHSGVSWKPEYEQELQEIDKEISVLRRQIDAALAARERRSGCEKNCSEE